MKYHMREKGGLTALAKCRSGTCKNHSTFTVNQLLCCQLPPLAAASRAPPNEDACCCVAHAAEALAPKVTFIRNMKRALLGDGRADARLLNEQDVIPYEKMLEFATWCSTHKAEGNELFGLRDRSEDKETTHRKAADFYNKVMKVWGFSKLQMNKKRKKITVSGKRIDVTPYQVIVADAWGVDGHVLHHLDARILQTN
jgi:hypothetical protein